MSDVDLHVRAFHVANDQPILNRPQIPNDERVRLRLRLIAEEFFELLAASFADGPRIIAAIYAPDQIRDCIEHMALDVDLPEFADALADLDFVIEGARLEFGIDGGPIADAVYAANMAKLGPDGKPIKRADGKVIKPEGWQPPDIVGELRKQGWEG